MTQQLGNYFAQAAVCVSRQDGLGLAALLRVDAPAPAAAVAAALRGAPLDVGGLASSRLPPPYDEVLALHCQCLAARAQAKHDDAYAAATGALAAMTREFRASESAWVVDPLLALARGLRSAAGEADAAAAAAGKAASKLSDAGSQLMKVFSAAFLSPSRDKKLATLGVVNQAFAVYFKLNTLRLCKNMIASVESANALPLDSYAVGQRVTYRFYTGRLAVFDEQYAKAAADLSLSLAECPRRAAANRARILQYLLPVKLLLGQLPSPTLLARHPGLAAYYAPVAEAVRRGDVRSLDAALEAHQASFIRAGTYLLLEKLRAGVHRTLLKKIHLIQKQRDAARAHQLPIALFQRALAWLGSPAELDEVECILANLIYRRYVKGYISHKARVIVLSKQTPFPPLSSVAFEDPA